MDRKPVCGTEQPENKRGHCTDGQSLEQGRNLEVKQTNKSSGQINQADVPRDKELFGQRPRLIKVRE